MVLNVAKFVTGYGTATYSSNPSTYCQNNTSASDYGKCYNILTNKAFFVQTDTTTYPTLPCESDGTCTRYTSTTWNRSLPLSSTNSSSTIFSYSGKQAILQYFYSRSHSSLRMSNNISYLLGIAVPTPSSLSPDYTWLFPAINYEVSSWPVYDPVENWKAYLNPYSITSGYVNMLRWQGNLFTPNAVLQIYEGNSNNIWYAFDMIVVWAYESSPLAIIPLDYDKDYTPYQELRNVFGYAATGIDQPGWNADDIISILKELFSNRAWAVFDDKTYMLYLYNLTVDHVPDWLVNRLSPVSMKVLQPPSDASVAQAWVNELNQRNAYNQPPAGVV